MTHLTLPFPPHPCSHHIALVAAACSWVCFPSTCSVSEVNGVTLAGNYGTTPIIDVYHSNLYAGCTRVASGLCGVASRECARQWLTQPPTHCRRRTANTGDLWYGEMTNGDGDSCAVVTWDDAKPTDVPTTGGAGGLEFQLVICETGVITMAYTITEQTHGSWSHTSNGGVASVGVKSGSFLLQQHFQDGLIVSPLTITYAPSSDTTVAVSVEATSPCGASGCAITVTPPPFSPARSPVPTGTGALTVTFVPSQAEMSAANFSTDSPVMTVVATFPSPPASTITLASFSINTGSMATSIGLTGTGQVYTITITVARGWCSARCPHDYTASPLLGGNDTRVRCAKTVAAGTFAATNSACAPYTLTSVVSEEHNTWLWNHVVTWQPRTARCVVRRQRLCCVLRAACCAIAATHAAPAVWVCVSAQARPEGHCIGQRARVGRRQQLQLHKLRRAGAGRCCVVCVLR